MPSHDLARTPPAVNKAKPKAADRSRDRIEVRLTHVGNAHTNEHHVNILTTKANMASTSWPVHSGEAGKYPRPTSERRPESIRAAGCKSTKAEAQKLTAVRLGAACCVLRAACCLLPAVCGLRGPVTPDPECAQTEVRTRNLSLSSVSTYPTPLTCANCCSEQKKPQIPWIPKKRMHGSLDASLDQYSPPPTACSQQSPSPRASSPLVPPHAEKVAAAAIALVARQESDRDRVARNAAKRGTVNEGGDDIMEEATEEPGPTLPADVDSELPDRLAEAAKPPEAKPPEVSLSVGYIYMYYESGTPREEKAPLSTGTILKTFTNYATKMMGFQAFDAFTIAATSNFGPWEIHGLEYAEAERFKTTNPTVSIEVPDGNDGYKIVMLDVGARRADLAAALGILPADDAAEPTTKARVYTDTMQASSHLRLEGGYCEAALTPTQIAAKITIHDAREAFKSIGLKVYRSVHVMAKIEDDDPMAEAGSYLPLGTNYLTNRFNFTVKPIDGNMKSFDWGAHPTVLLSKTLVVAGEAEPRVLETHINYTVGGDSLIDRAATIKNDGRTIMSICNKLTGCKMPTTICGGRCARLLVARSRFHKRLNAATEDGTSAKEARKAMREEKQRDYEARTNKGIEKVRTPEPVSKKRCERLVLGLCSFGDVCIYDHSFYGGPAEIATIKCNLPKRKQSGRCKKGSKCHYDCSLIPANTFNCMRDVTVTENLTTPPHAFCYHHTECMLRHVKRYARRRYTLRNDGDYPPTFTYVTPLEGPPPQPG